MLTMLLEDFLPVSQAHLFKYLKINFEKQIKTFWSLNGIQKIRAIQIQRFK